HLLPIPERVVILLAVVHRGVQPQPFVVHRVAAEDRVIKFVRLSGIIVGLSDGYVAGCRIAFASHQRPWQIFASFCVIDGSAQLSRGYSSEQRADYRSTSARMLG